MGQGDTATSRAEARREIRPSTWEFPDPRVAVLALLILVALLLQGRFGSLATVDQSAHEGSGSQGTQRGR